jgi:hypothetical protein
MGDRLTYFRVYGILLDAENLHAATLFRFTLVLRHGKPASMRYRSCCIPVCCKVLFKSKENIKTQKCVLLLASDIKIVLDALSSAETLSGYHDR